MTPLSLRRTEGAILQMMDLILRTKIPMLNGPKSLFILLLLIERGGTLSTMIIVTRIQKLTLNIVGIKNARLSLPILPMRFLEIVFFNGITSYSDMTNLEDVITLLFV